MPLSVNSGPSVLAEEFGVTGPFQRPKLNFIQGSNVTVAVVDNAALDKVDVTISASASGVTTLRSRELTVTPWGAASGSYDIFGTPFGGVAFGYSGTIVSLGVDWRNSGGSGENQGVSFDFNSAVAVAAHSSFADVTGGNTYKVTGYSGTSITFTTAGSGNIKAVLFGSN